MFRSAFGRWSASPLFAADHKVVRVLVLLALAGAGLATTGVPSSDPL